MELIQPMAYQIIEGRYLFKIHSYDEVGVEKVKLDIEGVNNYTLLNTEGSSYFEFELNTLVIQDGLYNVTVTSYDISGYTTTAPIVPIRVDNTAPGLIVYYPMSGDYISGENYTISGKAMKWQSAYSSAGSSWSFSRRNPLMLIEPSVRI